MTEDLINNKDIYFPSYKGSNEKLITLIHLTKEEWASSLTSNTELGSVANPALFLAAIRALRLLNVPPLAAIPPEKSLNPIFSANHLHNDSSSKVTLGDNS